MNSLPLLMWRTLGLTSNHVPVKRILQLSVCGNNELLLFATNTESTEELSSSCPRNTRSANLYVASVGFPNWIYGYGAPVSDCGKKPHLAKHCLCEMPSTYLEHALESFLESALTKSGSIKV